MRPAVKVVTPIRTVEEEHKMLMERSHKMMDAFFAAEPTMEDVVNLQWHMLDMPEEDKVKMEPQHVIHNNMYARALTIKEGDFAIGARHKEGQITVLMHGDLMFLTDNGLERIKGPAVWLDPPGIKRAVYAYETSTIITINAVDTNDLAEIEERLFEKEVDPNTGRTVSVGGKVE